MAGNNDLKYSLWLSPPDNSPLFRALQDLIDNISEDCFGGAAPKFMPHVTLTSQISVELNPKEVVDHASKVISVSDLRIEIADLDYGPIYTKKAFLRIKKTNGLLELAEDSRRVFTYLPTLDSAADAEDLAKEWIQFEYDPHISLVYWQEPDLDDDVKSYIEDALKELFANTQGSWNGGKVRLVDTSLPVDSWVVLAESDIC
ncbi:2',3'-cyclic-nucleotide 3'-phosphodiesterase [Dipodascopsis uninucleata]